MCWRSWAGARPVVRNLILTLLTQTSWRMVPNMSRSKRLWRSLVWMMCAWPGRLKRSPQPTWGWRKCWPMVDFTAWRMASWWRKHPVPFCEVVADLLVRCTVREDTVGDLPAAAIELKAEGARNEVEDPEVDIGLGARALHVEPRLLEEGRD